MLPHIRPNGEPDRPVFPILPIVTVDPPSPPKRSEGEKFGSLFYLGIVGLFVMVALIGWFGWGVWSLRSVWANVYTLHDASRDETARNQASYDLARDPGVTARQLYDIALERPLPPLSRYLVAEALPADAVEGDPRGYVLAVARSEGWPGWLRVLLARPLAYDAAVGNAPPREPLAELARNADPAVGLWALCALAIEGDEEAATALRSAASKDGPSRGLAARLVAALDATELDDRTKALDAATLWLRDHHPDAFEVWRGWEIVDGHVRRRPGP